MVLTPLSLKLDSSNQSPSNNPQLTKGPNNMSFSAVSKKSGKTYFLHQRLQELRGGQKVTLYYFGGEAKEGAIDALPAGYEISENERTGLPLLKKKK